MAQIVCDVCGGDLLKDGEFFVCQTCGCKYSLEEVRRKLTGGGAPAPAAAPAAPAAVQVSNAAQVENLMKMAQSAYDSKNYAKAEDFCDQVIAMDSGNYEAWKLKGEAINYQITAKNPRILEVYNCLMSAYRTLESADEGEKKGKADELMRTMKVCMEGEVNFWVDQFESGRPTAASLAKIKSTYNECRRMLKNAFDEFGMGGTIYLKYFDNLFCNKANQTCVSAWKSTVAYNYFRDSLGNLGAGWNRKLNKKEYIRSSNYRPNENIRSTFVEESGLLVDLLKFCTTLFNDMTIPKTKENIYSNMAYFTTVPSDQVSYKAMVSTTTNGYGAVINKQEYYEIDRYLTDGAKQARAKQAAEYTAKEQEAIQEGKQKKIDDYWKQHAEEKEKLVSELDALKKQDEELSKQLDAVPGGDDIKRLAEQINGLEAQKKGLGMFAGREKKNLQDQIDKLTGTLQGVKAERDKKQAEIRAKIEPIVLRCREINAELNKER